MRIREENLQKEAGYRYSVLLHLIPRLRGLTLEVVQNMGAGQQYTKEKGEEKT